jgi:hypothetical protein
MVSMTVTAENIAELRAELELLELFDRRRREQGRDYGSGQRAKELSRRRRELEPYAEGATEASAEELFAAFLRVGKPRLEDAGSSGAATAWRSIERELRSAAHLEEDRAELDESS